LLPISRRNFIRGSLATCVGISYAHAMQVDASIPLVVPGTRAANETNDTKLLQRAIDKAAERGGGTVHIQPGRYISGSLQLRSNVSLWLDSGVTLAGLVAGV
jgi:polygalacturonase